MAEQEYSLGSKAIKEGVCPVVSRARGHGKNTEILLPVEGENCMAKAQ